MHSIFLLKPVTCFKPNPRQYEAQVPLFPVESSFNAQVILLSACAKSIDFGITGMDVIEERLQLERRHPYPAWRLGLGIARSPLPSPRDGANDRYRFTQKLFIVGTSITCGNEFQFSPAVLTQEFAHIDICRGTRNRARSDMRMPFLILFHQPNIKR
jgi:hypothetical protein